MDYIIFDLEFNQDFSSLNPLGEKNMHYPFEIIQIGAIKLDSKCNTIGTFNRYIKPSLYTQVSPFITELTGITTNQLLNEALFPEVYHTYTEFIGEADSVFCIWGQSDIKELFRNAQYHQLSTHLLPRNFINLQPYAAMHLHLPSTKLLGLQNAISALHIPVIYPFHNAASDAYYTAEVFKKIYHHSINPNYYDPTHIRMRQKQVKQQIDTKALIEQFEKMYTRKMSEEEQAIIKLAYKMGKTNQFLK